MEDIDPGIIEISNKIHPEGTILMKPEIFISKDSLLHLMGVDPQNTFLLARERSSRFIEEVVFRNYEQFFNGVKVESGGLTIKSKKNNNEIIHFSPNIYYNISANTIPLIGESSLVNILSESDINSSELILTERLVLCN
ncbi:MAG: hypothetical protein EA362_01220 [Saprospirales bacterium]|nr:MAG: hypothetical protein EA362_01220 [Saprospirales bacterium]